MRVTKLTNIGTKLEKLLAEVDITTAEEFLKSDPYDLYNRLEAKYPDLHLAVLASFVGAQTHTPWYFVYHQTKKDFLRKR